MVLLPVKSGMIDLFGYDTNHVPVVIEVKRSLANISAYVINSFLAWAIISVPTIMQMAIIETVSIGSITKSILSFSSHVLQVQRS